MRAEALRTRSFTAMSCDATIVVHGGDRSLPTAAVGRIAELERRWSRFRDDSEISELNRSRGIPVRCSADTVTLVEASVRAWHVTEGAFDPTLLAALVGLGYGSSRTGTGTTSIAPKIAPKGRPDLVGVDRVASVVRLPEHTALDPGGIGKGLAADLVGRELVDAGASGALVEVGGDVGVTGIGPDDGAWTIAVQHPLGGDAEHVRLQEGGVATSSCRRRTWRTGPDELHHLLDPSTLRPTTGETAGCTVIAGTAAWAEAFTKVAFVRGGTAALEWYERCNLAARVVTHDGSTHTSAAWKDFVA